MSFTKSLILGVAALSTVVTALPTSKLNFNLCSRVTDVQLQGLSVTLTNGSATLPSPPAGQVLKAMTIGVGSQNYTCTGAPTDAPVAVGAVATLINAADDILPFLPKGEASTIMNMIPGFIYTIGRAAVDASGMAKSGVHYFDSTGVPTFDLTQSGVGLFKGGKSGDIKAPSNAVRGTNGAVDWLTLTSGAGSDGISTVYRIYTASGSAPATCQGQAQAISVPYSAQYWFYG